MVWRTICALPGIAVFGPSAAAAQLEGSKHFTKELCDRMGIPTAGYAFFDNHTAAKDLSAGQPCPHRHQGRRAWPQARA